MEEGLVLQYLQCIFTLLFEEGPLHLHSALGPTNYITTPDLTPLTGTET